jgi:hypothetical protein
MGSLPAQSYAEQTSSHEQNHPYAILVSYRDTLGFEVRNDVGYGGKRWITVGPTGQPGTSIVLYPPSAIPRAT